MSCCRILLRKATAIRSADQTAWIRACLARRRRYGQSLFDLPRAGPKAAAGLHSPNRRRGDENAWRLRDPSTCASPPVLRRFLWSPSTTLVCTRTVSPTAKSAASLRNCSDSILSSNAWFIQCPIGTLERWSSGVPGKRPNIPSCHHSQFTANPVCVLSFAIWLVRPANERSPRGCRTTTTPGLSGPGRSPGVCIAGIPANRD